MKNPSNSSNNLVIHYWFVCGHDTKVEVESAVRNESAVYGDILRLNYTETYSLLAFKTMSSLWLASTMDVQFIVKVDDDVYLHVPKMIWWLKTSSLCEKLYAGAVQGGVKSKVVNNFLTILGSLHTVEGPFIFYLKALFSSYLRCPQVKA